MRAVLKWTIQPLVYGGILALILQQFFPQITHSDQGWISRVVEKFKAPSLQTLSYYPIIKKVSPAVVHIFSIEVSPLDKKVVRKKSLGSGVIVSKKGYILTNNHVVANAKKFVVSLQDKRQAKAEIIGTDYLSDLAVLKINLPSLSVAKLISSRQKTNVGDIVLAIGNPFGLEQTVSSGIISATQRHLKINTYENFLQTDAAINPGNSGGALINTEGKMVGIITALLSSTGGNDGLGFAIPANLVRFVMQSLIAHGRVIRGWLGIEAEALTLEESAYMDRHGIFVTDVYSNGPAEKAGIKKGDIIISVNHKETNYEQKVTSYVATLAPGSRVVITVLRNKKKLTFTMRTTEMPHITTMSIKKNKDE